MRPSRRSPEIVVACGVWHVARDRGAHAHPQKQDPILEHSLSDGDVAFSLRMSSDMLSYASAYAMVPRYLQLLKTRCSNCTHLYMMNH